MRDLSPAWLESTIAATKLLSMRRQTLPSAPSSSVQFFVITENPILVERDPAR
jgi:hypothetical protein